MIQFNLLPDVKIQYIKTRYRKRMIMLTSAIASCLLLAIFILLFLFVKVNQPKHMRDLDKDISSTVTKIQETKDLDKILTIQNQLNSLPALHDKKVVSSRLIDFLNKVTPNQATISSVVVDFEANTIIISGTTDSFITVNKYADTLKFTDFKVNNAEAKTGKAFKDVVLRNFTIANDQSAKVTYDLTASFDPLIFTQVKDQTEGTQEPVELTVPKIFSTRSETEKPASLFSSDSTQSGGQR